MVIVSFIISMFVLFLARQVGWISLGEDLPSLVEHVMWNQFIWLAIIAGVFTATSHVLWLLYKTFVVATCCLGCFAMPVYMLVKGYLQLMAVTLILTGFTHTTVWWQVLILSLLVGVTDSAQMVTVTKTEHRSTSGFSSPLFTHRVKVRKPKPMPRSTQRSTQPKPDAAPLDLGTPLRGEPYETYEQRVARLKELEMKRKAEEE